LKLEIGINVPWVGVDLQWGFPARPLGDPTGATNPGKSVNNRDYQKAFHGLDVPLVGGLSFLLLIFTHLAWGN
jgi:hypothetical protein